MRQLIMQHQILVGAAALIVLVGTSFAALGNRATRIGLLRRRPNSSSRAAALGRSPGLVVVSTRWS
jgi:hypothetical protein